MNGGRFEINQLLFADDTALVADSDEKLLLLLLHCLSLSGQAGLLPIKGNKLLGSLGYRSNPQGVLLQAEWLRAEGEVGAIWPDSVWSRGTSTTERRPRKMLFADDTALVADSEEKLCRSVCEFVE